MYPTFPQLSRAPALKTKTSTDDPTLRDPMENGMVSSRPRFTRRRRTFAVTIDFLTPDDVTCLEAFVTGTVVFGSLIFLFPDNRDPHNPVEYSVRFFKLPSYDDVGWVGEGFAQNCSFELAEV